MQFIPDQESSSVPEDICELSYIVIYLINPLFLEKE